jgi:hypothetical protein
MPFPLRVANGPVGNEVGPIMVAGIVVNGDGPPFPGNISFAGSPCNIFPLVDRNVVTNVSFWTGPSAASQGTQMLYEAPMSD